MIYMPFKTKEERDAKLKELGLTQKRGRLYRDGRIMRQGRTTARGIREKDYWIRIPQEVLDEIRTKLTQAG